MRRRDLLINVAMTFKNSSTIGKVNLINIEALPQLDYNVGQAGSINKLCIVRPRDGVPDDRTLLRFVKMGLSMKKACRDSTVASHLFRRTHLDYFGSASRIIEINY